MHPTTPEGGGQPNDIPAPPRPEDFAISFGDEREPLLPDPLISPAGRGVYRARARREGVHPWYAQSSDWGKLLSWLSSGTPG